MTGSRKMNCRTIVLLSGLVCIYDSIPASSGTAVQLFSCHARRLHGTKKDKKKYDLVEGSPKVRGRGVSVAYSRILTYRLVRLERDIRANTHTDRSTTSVSTKKTRPWTIREAPALSCLAHILMGVQMALVVMSAEM